MKYIIKKSTCNQNRHSAMSSMQVAGCLQNCTLLHVVNLKTQYKQKNVLLFFMQLSIFRLQSNLIKKTCLLIVVERKQSNYTFNFDCIKFDRVASDLNYNTFSQISVFPESQNSPIQQHVHTLNFTVITSYLYAGIEGIY